MTYDEYKKLGGLISEHEFNQLLPYVRELLLDYTSAVLVPAWRMKASLDDMVETLIIYYYQLDFIAMNGGLNVFYGHNDLDLKQVTTGGFTYSIGAGGKMEFFKGVPMSPLALSNLKRQLRAGGYLQRCL